MQVWSIFFLVLLLFQVKYRGILLLSLRPPHCLSHSLHAGQVTLTSEGLVPQGVQGSKGRVVLLHHHSAFQILSFRSVPQLGSFPSDQSVAYDISLTIIKQCICLALGTIYRSVFLRADGLANILRFFSCTVYNSQMGAIRRASSR